MNDNVFIGIGPNPQGKDLPLGLGMQLAQNAKAMNQYASLSQPQRDQIVHYIQGCISGDDAKQRIASVIQRLSAGESMF